MRPWGDISTLRASLKTTKDTKDVPFVTFVVDFSDRL